MQTFQSRARFHKELLRLSSAIENAPYVMSGGYNIVSSHSGGNSSASNSGGGSGGGGGASGKSRASSRTNLAGYSQD